MKVTMVREVRTLVEEVIYMTPYEYMEARANTSKFNQDMTNKVSVKVLEIRPATEADEDELYKYLK